MTQPIDLEAIIEAGKRASGYPISSMSLEDARMCAPLRFLHHPFHNMSRQRTRPFSQQSPTNYPLHVTYLSIANTAELRQDVPQPVKLTGRKSRMVRWARSWSGRCDPPACGAGE
jgi:hypothetical protein